MQMPKAIRFLGLWLVANVIGFMIGNFLGATNGGLIRGLAGDLVFGATFGLAQWLVVQDVDPTRRWRWLAWVLASAVGFTLGVRAAARVAVAVATDHMLIGLAFGAIVGPIISTALSGVIWWVVRPTGRRLSQWWVACALGWLAGEVTAFAFHFAPSGVPFVALAIAALTGLGLIPLLSPEFARPNS